jgi:hypothetical protein
VKYNPVMEYIISIQGVENVIDFEEVVKYSKKMYRKKKERKNVAYQTYFFESKNKTGKKILNGKNNKGS